MNKAGKTAAVFICLSVLIGFVAGCEGQEQMDARKTRLLADENRRLRQELADCETQVEEKNQQIAGLEKARATVGEGEDKMIAFLSEMLADFVKENEVLTEENKKLIAKVEELQKQIDSLRAGSENPAGQ